MSQSNQPAPHEPTAHRDLFSSLSTDRAQPTLGDFQPSLPVPTDDPDEDLSVDPLSDKHLNNATQPIREGSTVTINTAYQGIVTDLNAHSPGDLDLDKDELDTFHFKSFTVEPHNPDAPESICVWKAGSTYGTDDFQMNYQLPDGTEPTVKHLAVDNEYNLEDDIVEDRYRIFAKYSGGSAMKLSNSSVTLVGIEEVRDGVLTINDPTARRSSTSLLVNGIEAGEDTWLLSPSPETDADHPTIVLGAENPLTDTELSDVPLTSAHEVPLESLPLAQQSVLAQVRSLPDNRYYFSEEGLKNTITVAGPETRKLAFPSADVTDASTAPHYSIPDGSAAASLSSPITSISGIGKTTATNLSNLRSQWTKSNRQLKNKLDNSEFVEEVDPDPNIQAELEDARANADLNADRSDRQDINTVAEFLGNGTRAAVVADQYFASAIADLRETIITHTDDPLTQLFVLHAGATRGHLFDESGSHLGHVANVLTGGINLGSVSIGAAVSHIPADQDTEDSAAPKPSLTTPSTDNENQENADRLHILATPGTFDAGDAPLDELPNSLTIPTDVDNGVSSVDSLPAETIFSTLPPVSQTVPDSLTDQISSFRTGLDTDETSSFRLTTTTTEYIASLLDIDPATPSSDSLSMSVNDGAALTIGTSLSGTPHTLEYTVVEQQLSESDD